MLFTSYEFLGFLVVLFILYYALPSRAQWPLLLAASYLFYGCADPSYLLYILATTGTTYGAARFIQKNADRQRAYLKAHKQALSREEQQAYKARQKAIRRRWLVGGLLIGLGILAVVKYTNFVISNLNGILSALGQGEPLSFVTLAMPMGISFYTFQAVGYLVDVYRGTVTAEKNPFRVALFLAFSPSWCRAPSAGTASCPRRSTPPIPFPPAGWPGDCSGCSGATSKSW